MGTSLPMYVDVAQIAGPVTTGEATTATQIVDSVGNGCAGVLIRGVQGILASTGGKVTVNIYDGATVASSRQHYSVELDFTSLTQTSDTQSPGIPIMKDPYITLTADATANTKVFVALVYLQKISVTG